MDEKTLVGKPYSPEICEGYDWDGLYPVVSGGVIVAIYDARWGEPVEYKNKPIVNDEYIDADAEDRDDDYPPDDLFAD